MLRLGRITDDGTFGSAPVQIGADGAFVARDLPPGTYIAEVVRTPYSATKPAVPVAFQMLHVTNADLRDVRVEIRRDTAVTGRFRMESDNPAAVWPPHIHVNAQLALDGLGFAGSKGADGAPAGTFILRKAFGPRVLRSGYTLAPNSWWWPLRVLLDGVDITNVPTDFSEHETGHLEVVFTQRPTRLRGTVADADDAPVRRRGSWSRPRTNPCGSSGRAHRMSPRAIRQAPFPCRCSLATTSCGPCRRRRSIPGQPLAVRLRNTRQPVCP